MPRSAGNAYPKPHSRRSTPSCESNPAAIRAPCKSTFPRRCSNDGIFQPEPSRLKRQPANAQEALAWLRYFQTYGIYVDLGLMQVSSYEAKRRKIDPESLLDPCTNLRAGWQILEDAYRIEVATYGPGQTALQHALSRYNTGDTARGFDNGYVQRVLAALRPFAKPISIQPGEAKMIDAEDFQVADGSTLKNKLGITNPDALAAAVSECTSRRLTELQASPIRGGFDASHLQEIHRYLYQDVFDWAGELRRIEKGGAPHSDLESALNRVFDRLSRENLLKGSRQGRSGHAGPLTTSKSFARSIRFSQAMILPSRNSPRNSPARTICNLNGGRHRKPQRCCRFCGTSRTLGAVAPPHHARRRCRPRCFNCSAPSHSRTWKRAVTRNPRAAHLMRISQRDTQ